MRFAIFALPRSGSTWASMWLSDGLLVRHDPFAWAREDAVLKMDAICCTGGWMIDGFMEKLNCRIALITRDPEDVNLSLERCGAPVMTDSLIEKFNAIDGRRFNYEDLFTERAEEMWDYLRPDKRFDPHRHWELARMNIQPEFRRWQPDAEILRELMPRIAA